MKHLHLIVNPVSGTRQARKHLPEMIAALSRGGYMVTVCVTEQRGDAYEFAKAHAGDADMVVACGGDGTLNEVITGLLSGGHATPLGYLPAGSTNDFAATLSLSSNMIKGCERIVSAEPRFLDVGRFGADRYFSYTASFGAFTSTSYTTSQGMKNILGHAAYVLRGITSLSGIHPIHMKITADGQEYEHDYIFGAVCNSTSLGGILKLKDDGIHMNDGLFEALLIPFPSGLAGLNRIVNALSAHRYDSPSLVFIRASSFTFEGAPDLKWTLDGEEAAGGGLLTIENLHNAVRFVY